MVLNEANVQYMLVTMDSPTSTFIIDTMQKLHYSFDLKVASPYMEIDEHLNNIKAYSGNHV